jgi:hypothetical protein
MITDAIREWLQRKKSRGAIGQLLLAVVTLLGGIGVLFFTFWFTYAIVWFGFQGVSAVSSLASGKRLQLSHEWRLGISAGFLGLLFLQHLRTSPWHWGNYPVRDDYSPGAGRALGPWALLRYPGASANMIADILLSGPRLVTGAGKMMRQANRLRRLDVDGCSQLIAFLASRPGAVPFDELREAGWEDWFDQLRCVEGIVFLQKGLGLTAEFRKELASLKPIPPDESLTSSESDVA